MTEYNTCSVYIYVHFKYGRRDRREIRLQKKKIEIDVVSFARYLQPLFRSYANHRHLRAAFKFAPSGLILRKRAGLTNDEGLHTKRSIPPFLRAILLLSAIPIRSLFLLFFPPPPPLRPVLPSFPFSSLTSERISFKILNQNREIIALHIVNNNHLSDS